MMPAMARAAPIAHLAYRGDGSDRPTTIPLPPTRAPMVRGWKLRKQWRYVEVWSHRC